MHQVKAIFIYIYMFLVSELTMLSFTLFHVQVFWRFRSRAGDSHVSVGCYPQVFWWYEGKADFLVKVGVEATTPGALQTARSWSGGLDGSGGRARLADSTARSRATAPEPGAGPLAAAGTAAGPSAQQRAERKLDSRRQRATWTRTRWWRAPLAAEGYLGAEGWVGGWPGWSPCQLTGRTRAGMHLGGATMGGARVPSRAELMAQVMVVHGRQAVVVRQAWWAAGAGATCAPGMSLNCGSGHCVAGRRSPTLQAVTCA